MFAIMGVSRCIDPVDAPSNAGNRLLYSIFVTDTTSKAENKKTINPIMLTYHTRVILGIAGTILLSKIKVETVNVYANTTIRIEFAIAVNHVLVTIHSPKGN